MVGMTEGDTAAVVHAADMGVWTEKRWVAGVTPDAVGLVANHFGVPMDLAVMAKGDLVVLPIGICR
jgi:hypothetical protein